MLSAKKKKPFLSEKAFLVKNGFTVVDTLDEYELLAVSFDGTVPSFGENVKKQITQYCETNKVPFQTIKVDSLNKAKSLPCIFNNWAVFFVYEEGLCVQIMHTGAYENEPLHHEIYLSNPQKTDTEKLKTVIRHPIKQTES